MVQIQKNKANKAHAPNHQSPRLLRRVMRSVSKTNENPYIRALVFRFYRNFLGRFRDFFDAGSCGGAGWIQIFDFAEQRENNAVYADIRRNEGSSNEIYGYIFQQSDPDRPEYAAPIMYYSTI